MAEGLLAPAGLAHDRTFMVIDEDGRCRTQREHPRLALVRPEIHAEGAGLSLSDPASGGVEIDVDTCGTRRNVSVLGTACTGIDQGDVVAEWLSDTLRSRSRLVRVPPEHARVTAGRTPGTSGYADSCPVHLLSTASLDSLNRRLAANGSPAMSVDRFRPNIVVAGWNEPHAEDGLRRVSIGAAGLGYAKLAIRCVVTTVDQDSGTRAGPEPLRTLAEYRRAAEGGLAFGTKFAVTGTGTISVGDEVRVQQWGVSEL